MTDNIAAFISMQRSIRRLADTIATDLFRNGQGEIAVTLKLELEDGTVGGGWCRKAVRDRIEAYLARLVGKHLLACTATGVHLTALGLEKLGKGFEPLPVGEALREHWLHVLPKGERQLFQILCLAWPKAQSRDALSEQTGYKRSSRDAYLSRLATRQLVEAVGLGEVKAADTLFEN